MTESVAAYLTQQNDAIIERLKALLRLPSVSTDPAYAEGMQATRQFLLDRLKAMGLADVQLLHGGGHDAVYGSWTGAPGAPTIIIYGHYDVQPPEPLELWKSPPFEPTIRDGRIYARGASDVKGSTLIAIETVAAYLKVTGKCPVNIKFFLEGEEESGSRSLRPIVERYGPLLKADAMISADGGRASVDVPTIGTGARGIAALELTVRTASKDLHSGRYGGAVRNALNELAALIASLHDADGRILVTGLLAEVPELTPRQRADSAELPMDEAGFYAEMEGLAWGDGAYTIQERLTLRPTIEVNGMWGGYTGTGTKTVIPSQARAKLTLRLVPGQTPQHALDAVRRHLLAHARKGVELTFSSSEGSAAFSLEDGHPLLEAAERVIERTSNRKPVRVRRGGSIPIMTIFKDMLGLDTLTFGFAMPDEDVHAPNEFFRLSSIPEGLQAWTLLLAELAKYKPEDFRARA